MRLTQSDRKNPVKQRNFPNDYILFVNFHLTLGKMKYLKIMNISYSDRLSCLFIFSLAAVILNDFSGNPFKFIKFKCNDYDFIFDQNQVFGFPAKHAKYNIINVTVY